MVRWRPTPPGLVLEDDEELSCVECSVEWVAYFHESHSDVLLSLGILAVLYDMLFTPCLWLLPVEVPYSALVAGIAIDVICLVGLVSSTVVWGLRDNMLRSFLDLLTCLPWELLGFMDDGVEPWMAARTIAKVRPRRAARATPAAHSKPAARVLLLCMPFFFSGS